MEEEEKWNENEGMSVPFFFLKKASITGACARGARSRRERGGLGARVRTVRVRVHALGLAAQERHRGGITLWTKYQRLL